MSIAESPFLRFCRAVRLALAFRCLEWERDESRWAELDNVSCEIRLQSVSNTGSPLYLSTDGHGNLGEPIDTARISGFSGPTERVASRQGTTAHAMEPLRTTCADGASSFCE